MNGVQISDSNKLELFRRSQIYFDNKRVRENGVDERMQSRTTFFDIQYQ